MSLLTRNNIAATAVMVLFGVQAAAAAAISSSSAAMPTVQAVTATIATANSSALAPVPSNLAEDVRAFLNRYQDDANEAAISATAAGLSNFPDEGLCTQQYPCFSVSRVGVVQLSGGASFTVSKVDALLAKVLAQNDIPLDQASNSQTILSGTKLGTADLTLEVIAPAGTISGALLAGSVFDLLKTQGFQTTSNAVRGMGVGGGPNGASPMALCVFPTGMEGSATTNFCMGKELDGSPSVPTTSKATGPQRRFNLVGLVAGLCSFIDIPLLCPSEE